MIHCGWTLIIIILSTVRYNVLLEWRVDTLSADWFCSCPPPVSWIRITANGGLGSLFRSTRRQRPLGVRSDDRWMTTDHTLTPPLIIALIARLDLMKLSLNGPDMLLAHSHTSQLGSVWVRCVRLGSYVRMSYVWKDRDWSSHIVSTLLSRCIFFSELITGPGKRQTTKEDRLTT